MLPFVLCCVVHSPGVVEAVLASRDRRDVMHLGCCNIYISPNLRLISDIHICITNKSIHCI